jgi:osmotically-inducible protein OsmY
MATYPGRNHRSGHHSTSQHGEAVGILAAADHRTRGRDASTDSRSDEDQQLERRVRNFLAQRSVPGLRRLAIEVDGTSVVLRGQVRSYYEKQLAVHCCRRVAGVIDVVDAIEVSSND